MPTRFVEKQGTMQMNSITKGQMIEEKTWHNKKIMHLHQLVEVTHIYSICCIWSVPLLIIKILNM